MIHILWCTLRPEQFKSAHSEWIKRADNPQNIQTYVAVNDILYNGITGSQAIITSVGSTDLDTSPTGSAATGVGYATNAATASAPEQRHGDQ